MDEERRQLPMKGKQIVEEIGVDVDDEAYLEFVPSINIVEEIGVVDDETYLESVPSGWRFRPTSRELLEYLKAKVFNLPLPANQIHDVNIYNYHPQDLTRKQLYAILLLLFIYLFILMLTARTVIDRYSDVRLIMSLFIG
jgi:hypothetical protein